MKLTLITNKENVNLTGFLEGGSKKELKNKLVILCHGFLGNKDNWFFQALSKKISESGYSCFRFDFSGCGDSQGAFEESTISKQIEDIASVVDYFKKKGYQIFSLIGHSMGGTEVLVYQSKYADAKCIVAIAPRVYNAKAVTERYSKEQLALLDTQGFFMYTNSAQKTYKITKKFIDDRMKNYTDIRTYAKKIMSPVLLVHGTGDITTNISESRELSASLENASMILLKEIEQATHGFEQKEHEESLLHTISSFLERVNRDYA